MSPQTPLEQSYLVLIRFLLLSKKRVVDLGGEYDLTAMQTLTLFQLDVPRPMNSFRKIFNCDPSNITGLVDGLEQKQLVSRYEDPSDRRIKMVKLEVKGQRIRTTLLQQLAADDNPLLAKLNQTEKQTFIQLLQKITTD